MNLDSTLAKKYILTTEGALANGVTWDFYRSLAAANSLGATSATLHYNVDSTTNKIVTPILQVPFPDGSIAQMDGFYIDGHPGAQLPYSVQLRLTPEGWVMVRSAMLSPTAIDIFALQNMRVLNARAIQSKPYFPPFDVDYIPLVRSTVHKSHRHHRHHNHKK